jgi:hypothetical protein
MPARKVNDDYHPAAGALFSPYGAGQGEPLTVGEAAALAAEWRALCQQRDLAAAGGRKTRGDD